MLEGCTRSVDMNITYISTSYRDAEFLKACNNSVLRQQDVTSHHIVMIDGYESKHLFDFIENKKNCSKTTIIQNAFNKGKSSCVNEAIAKCSTRYIGLLDADDVIFPGKSYEQINYLQENPAKAAVGCSYIRFLDKKKTMMQFVPATIKMKQMWRQIVTGPTSLYSSIIVDQSKLEMPIMDERLECAMDYKFNLDCVVKGLIGNITGFHCGYRVREKSITRSEKRIDQLRNHSTILMQNIQIDSELTDNDLQIAETIFAAGLGRIAKVSPDIQKELNKAVTTKKQKNEAVISKIKEELKQGSNSLLSEPLLTILNIGAER